MFFKSMEIYGFKSFPDKTILHFDKRMTAVVGSNGNGKSNISDALRWVMGEQGAKVCVEIKWRMLSFTELYAESRWALRV